MKRPARKLAWFFLLTLIGLYALLPGRALAAVVERGVVVLVEFPDVKHSIDRQSVQNRFAVQLNNYVREMSYGQVSLSIDVTRRWYRMPDSIKRYSISPPQSGGGAISAPEADR